MTRKTVDNNVMHTKPDLRVFLKWMIARSGSVITDVIPLKRGLNESRTDAQMGVGIPNRSRSHVCLDDADVIWLIKCSINCGGRCIASVSGGHAVVNLPVRNYQRPSGKNIRT